MSSPNIKEDLTDDVSVLGNDNIGGLFGMGMDDHDNNNNMFNNDNNDDGVIDFALDDANDVTHGRRIARHLIKHGWCDENEVNEIVIISGRNDVITKHVVTSIQSPSKKQKQTHATFYY